MSLVRSIIYRYLTHADFYNMYKPRDSELGGGGQTYIDFPTQDVPVSHWEAFFDGIPGVRREVRAQGTAWTAPIRSIGIGGSSQSVLVYQRRGASVSVANQTLNRQSTNRLHAWHPDNGFPVPRDPRDRRQLPNGLVVYFVRTDDSTLWAGWLLNDSQSPLSAAGDITGALRRLFTVPPTSRHRAGSIEFGVPVVWLNEADASQPFQARSEGVASTARGASQVAIDTYPKIPEPQAKIGERRQRESARATDAQGLQLDPARRKAVELHAMVLAKAAYPGAEDTSATESYDLRTIESGVEVRVEVKGTLGAGEHVLVTANEVSNSHGDGWRTDLYVVSNIKLREENGVYVAQGGDVHAIRGWVAQSEDLTPTQYRYRVPR